VIVLGCAGMADLAARLSESHGLPVIDGVASAVKLGEAFGALGLKTSKIGAYALPRPKAYLGAICILRTTLENRSASERPDFKIGSRLDGKHRRSRRSERLSTTDVAAVTLVAEISFRGVPRREGTYNVARLCLTPRTHRR
jgi:hypothetical protein